MKHELLTVLATYSFYFMGDMTWVMKVLSIVFPILILKYIPDVDKRIRIFMWGLLTWNMVDLLSSAIGEPKKNDLLVHRYANTQGNAPSVDAGLGQVAAEVSQECGEASNSEPEMGTQDVGRAATPDSV
jgi:hypothetical protein